MNPAQIGIRIANGKFYPVLQENPGTQKKMILTTVKDDQESVQIGLYKHSEDGDEEYVGSLIIENIPKGKAGAAEISLLLSVDTMGNLNATASEETSGEYQSLSVNLEGLSKSHEYGIPDFEIGTPEEDLDLTVSDNAYLGDIPYPEERVNDFDGGDLSDLDDQLSEDIGEDSGAYTGITRVDHHDEVDEIEEPPKKINYVAMILMIIFGVAVALGLTTLVFNVLKGEEIPDLLTLLQYFV